MKMYLILVRKTQEGEKAVIVEVIILCEYLQYLLLPLALTADVINPDSHQTRGSVRSSRRALKVFCAQFLAILQFHL